MNSKPIFFKSKFCKNKNLFEILTPPNAAAPAASIATKTLFDTKAINLDLSELQSNSTNSSTTQYDSESTEEHKTIIINDSLIQNSAEYRNSVKTTFAPYTDQNPFDGSSPRMMIDAVIADKGNVKALRNFFEQLKMPRERLTNSSPNLTKNNDHKLSATERQTVLDQLKYWSEFGTADKNQISSSPLPPQTRIKQKLSNTEPNLTRSVLNLTVTTSFDDHTTSKIQITENTEKSASEPNLNVCADIGFNAENRMGNKISDLFYVKKQKITANIQPNDKYALSCPNLFHMKTAAKAGHCIFNSKFKASIHNSPHHRSTHLTLRKIKQNKKINKMDKQMHGNSSTDFGQLSKSLNDSDGGDEPR